jgi:hypothetical protein
MTRRPPERHEYNQDCRFDTEFGQSTQKLDFISRLRMTRGGALSLAHRALRRKIQGQRN